MAGVLSVDPGSGDTVDDARVLGGVRLQVLDGGGSAERMLPGRRELPDCAAGLQRRVPRRRSDATFHERRVQWDRGMGVQFGVEWGDSLGLFEFLRQNSSGF